MEEKTPERLSRRQFQSAAVSGIVLAASAAVLPGCTRKQADPEAPVLIETNRPISDAPEPVTISRKVKLGVIGCGERGSWLPGFFVKHGGFDLHALADYFPDEVERSGAKHGVPKSRQFSGADGYKRLLDSGVEAVVICNVPYFYPVQARAAVEAGCHVWLAKPVAVDVPGCTAISAAGKLATQKKQCFLVDYQIPTDPTNIAVADRIREGGLGKLAFIGSIGYNVWTNDPAKNPGNESLLRRGCWGSTIALCGDIIAEYSIHILDTVLWVVAQRPKSASGCAIRCREGAQGDRHDAIIVDYQFEDGIVWSHRSQSFNNNEDQLLRCNIYGEHANAQLGYTGKAFVRGGPKHFGGGEVRSLYDQGVWRNVTAFYRQIIEGSYENLSVQRAVDGVLTAILGREAATRGQRLTMDELLKENSKLEFDIS